MPQVVDLPKFSMQGALAAMFTITSCYLWATHQVVPQDLLLINGIVVSFFFGNKAGSQAAVNAINAAAVAPAPLAPPYIPPVVIQPDGK